MGVTDEELQEQQERVESLRVQVAEVNAEREAAEREAANQVTYDKLKVEEQRLTAALEAARNAGVNTANAEAKTSDPAPAPSPSPAPAPSPAVTAVSAVSPTARLGTEPSVGGPAADQNNKEN